MCVCVCVCVCGGGGGGGGGEVWVRGFTFFTYVELYHNFHIFGFRTIIHIKFYQMCLITL